MHSKRSAFAIALTALMVGMLSLAAVSRAVLPDQRGWEMVSPVDKNGGQVDGPGGIAGGGVLQAAIGGGAVSYSSAASFGPEATGAPPASQYVSARGEGAWATKNITTAVTSGSYGIVDEGVPYQLFSPDLSRALLFDGKHCRGEASGCGVANPPLPGTDAPTGFQNYYLWEGGSFEALIGVGDIAGHGLEASTFDVRLAGASPELGTVLLSSCSPLTPGAADGCGATKANLYRWTHSGGLSLVNATPGAQLAAQSGAVSADGEEIYWLNTNNGNLYLSDAGAVSQVDSAAGGGGTFQTASADGSVAYFTKSGHLWRYAAGAATDLTPGGGVLGVLGASTDGLVVYYQDGSGLQRWEGGSTTQVAPGAEAAEAGAYPPATGKARVSADGTKLLFVSKEQLTGYDNTDQNTGLPDSEVFLYDSSGPGLACVSCNRGSKAPIGPSTIPGAVANGTAPGSLAVFKPRVLSSSGKRVFFDSADALVSSDSNANPVSGLGVTDVYEWEAEGEGSCVAGSESCLAILSNGALPQGASFVDASSDGADAFFLTASSLVKSDPGSQDVYDARVNGGFPVVPPTIPCEGDACQILPAVPRSPTLATVVAGLGNPAVEYHKYCRKGYVKRKQICVKRGTHRHKGHKHSHHGGNG
jgi:hypothetical protein